MIKEQIVNSGHGSLSPQFLVVHSTANPGATAQNHANYWRTNDYAVHYVSDWNEALHTMEDNRKAWHVGNANYCSIGIEICEATNAADVQKGLKIAAQACKEILQKHGWGIDKLTTHDWCRRNYGGTDHTDPFPYFKKWGITWEQFVAMVNGAEVPNVSQNDSAWTKPATGDLNKLADAVLRGEFGNGEERKQKLGANYDAVQAIVNSRLNGTTASSSPDINALAEAVIAGEYGNGDQRKQKLGNLYDAVQKVVNEKLNAKGTASKPATKPAVDIDALAQGVIAGKYGNGDERKKALGSNYDAVQKRVNEILGSGKSSAPAVNIDALARDVIAGKYGNGDARKKALGANYDAVQKRVNEMLR